MKDCTIVTFLLYLLAVLAICAAQSSPTHIYDGDNVIAVEAAGGPISCANTMIMLKNDPTQTSCFALLNSTYGVVDLGCPEELVGATQLVCDQGFNALSCWALNPTTNTIVAIWQNQVQGYMDLNGLLTPKVFSVKYDPNNDQMSMIIVDAHNNSVWSFLVDYPFGDYFTYVATPTVAVGNVSSVVLYDTDSNSYLMVSEGDTTISQYDIYNELPLSTFGTFGHLKSLAVDAYESIYAVDSACSCIRKIDFEGNVQRTINGISTHVKMVTLNRRKTFVVDDTGIWKYEEEQILKASVAMTKPITCDGQPGSVSIQVEGQGDYPFSVLVIPDCITKTFNAPGNTTIPISLNPLQAYETLILDDELNRNFQLNGLPLAGRGFYNKTEIPGGAKFGNYSYGWKFTPANTGFAVWSGGMQTAQFEWFEFWLNIGLGGQKFTFQLNPSPELITISPGDLKIGTWYQYRLSFPYYLFKRQSSNANAGFGSLQIVDLNRGPNQNMIYIDGVKIIPYANKFPTRTAYMYDACGLSIDPIPVPFVYEPLKVSIKGKPVSCNVNTTTAQHLAYNGVLEAVVENGEGPFFYNWSYSPLNQSVVTGFPILNSWITVYDNQLNKSWVDISIGDTYNLNETSVYHSAPSSISFTVTNEGQGLIFQVSPEINMHDYDTLEFWANGGPIGGQTFSIYLLRSTSGAVVQTTSFPTASNMVSLPPNQWVKMSFTLPVATILNKDAKYNLVEIVSTVPNNPLSPTQPTEQPILYLDDIILLGKNVLTVTDNRGCKVSTQFARIVTPPAISQTINVNHAKCFNSTDGIVNVMMTGGVSPFDFVWSGSEVTTETLYNLAEGFVYVNATDSNECTFKPAVATVLQPPPITLEMNITQPKCFGGIGLATASAYGGSGTFTYNWLSSTTIPQTIPSPNPEAIFLDALTFPLHTDYASIVCRGTGSHLNMDVAPTHSGYCTLSLNPVLAQPSTEIRGCQACFNKGRYETVSFWIFTDIKEVLEDFYITMSQDNVKSNYSIPITSVLNVEVHKWQQVIFHLDYFSDLQSPDGIAWITNNVSHFDGTVLVDDVVAFPRISNGAGYGALPGYISTMQVKAADYFVSLVDSNGCSSITKVVVPQPDQINITYTSSSPTYQDGNDGKIKVTVNGGTPPYSYHWLEINLTTENIENVVYGAYVLQVTDAHGCVAELNAYINPYIPVVEVTIRKYNANLSSGLAALVSVGFIICLFSGTMLFRYWASFSVLGSFLSTMILFGCVLSFLSALVLLPEPTDALCQSFIWFLGVGFALVYGCLFIKTWALYKVWRNAVHYHKAALTPLYIVKCLGLVVTIEVIFLAVWTAIDPPKVHLVKSLNNTLERQCNTNNMTFWIIFLVGKGAWLIFGAVLSVLTKNIAKEYNESSSIAYAIYNNVLLGAIAIPLAILLKEVPGGRLTVEVVIITIAFSFTLVVIFFKIWHNIILPDKIPMGREMRKNRNTASSTGSIKSNSGERQSKGSPTLSASASVSTVNLRDGELSEA